MAEDQKNAGQAIPTEDQEVKTTRLELVRVILDFIAKCFYPGIAITLLILLYPTLQ
jgi:hypothetical protein